MEKVQDEWTSSAWSGSSCAFRLIGLVIMSTVLKGKHVYRDENPSLLRALVSDNTDADAPPIEEQLNCAGSLLGLAQSN